MPDPDARAWRRQQVHALRAQGVLLRDIAAQLGVSLFTVKADLSGYVRPSRRGDTSTPRPRKPAPPARIAAAAQRPRTPGQHAYGHAPIEPNPLRDLGRDVRCTCPSAPFCTGVGGADWLACSTSCKACVPSPWQPPAG